jgi:hypothetical protein
MVLIEFTSPNFPSKGAKHHFVGVSYGAVMADTNGGKKFGFASFSFHREITEEEARALNLGLLEEGIAAVREGCQSFKLDTPR